MSIWFLLDVAKVFPSSHLSTSLNGVVEDVLKMCSILPMGGETLPGKIGKRSEPLPLLLSIYRRVRLILRQKLRGVHLLPFVTWELAKLIVFFRMSSSGPFNHVLQGEGSFNGSTMGNYSIRIRSC
jgi:hypothetical protein